MILPKIVKSYNQNNQLILTQNGLYFELTFQSYNTVIMHVCNRGVIFNRNLDVYTKTTLTYLTRAINDIVNDIGLACYTNTNNYDMLSCFLDATNKKNAVINHLIRCYSYILDDNINDDTTIKEALLLSDLND